MHEKNTKLPDKTTTTTIERREQQQTTEQFKAVRTAY
jgi:hypothetical protein